MGAASTGDGGDRVQRATGARDGGRWPPPRPYLPPLRRPYRTGADGGDGGRLRRPATNCERPPLDDKRLLLCSSLRQTGDDDGDRLELRGKPLYQATLRRLDCLARRMKELKRALQEAGDDDGGFRFEG